MNQKSFVAAVQRIRSINWNFRLDPLRSDYLLLLEYLRRRALWFRRLGLETDWRNIDLSASFGEVNETQERVISELIQELWTKRANRYQVPICRRYILWEAMVPPTVVPATGLPPPFESAIVMFERGSGFYIEEGMAYIGDGSLGIWLNPVDWYTGKEPFTSLNASELDAHDREGI